VLVVELFVHPVTRETTNAKAAVTVAGGAGKQHA
jgi:hypothetical protein